MVNFNKVVLEIDGDISTKQNFSMIKELNLSIWRISVDLELN